VRIDLNCDLGESFGIYRLGDDEAVLPFVTSANLACGFHGGDPSVIRRTVRLARQHGVRIGAHPGFPDLAGFGRRELLASPEEIEDLVLYQIAALAGIARAERIELHHVKLHGALFALAARDAAVAAAVARAITAFDRSLMLYAMPGTEVARQGHEAGLRVVLEGFADRAYAPDGRLASRRTAGALIDDPAQVVARAVRMVRDGEVIATDGSTLRVQIETLCVHGDTPGVGGLVRRLRAALEAEGIDVGAP
jgi:UPF0271 protein